MVFKTYSGEEEKSVRNTNWASMGMERRVYFLVLAAISLYFYACATGVNAFSAQTSGVGDASVSKARLAQNMRSPSGKMTISPEIFVPEPTEATAILLQQSEIASFSEALRVQAKANAAFISGSVPTLRQFAREQESAKGNFPGPVPVIFCNARGVDFGDIADAGASGVVIPINCRNEVDYIDSADLDIYATSASNALQVGIQPIPELQLSSPASWEERTISAIVKTLKEASGGSLELVIVTLKDDDHSNITENVAFPPISKEIKKETPVIFSVREKAGEGRLGAYVQQLKDLGYTGCYLRSECVPDAKHKPDLAFLRKFWTAVIADLKSVRSKTFGGFRAKNEMNKGSGILENWATYQNALVDADVLPTQSAGPEDLDADRGDYKGF